MEETELRIDVALADADAAELDKLTERLRRDLLQLDVTAVTRPHEGEPPAGSRAVELAALGALILHLAQTPGLLAGVVTAVQSWLGGRADRSVRIETGGDVLELTGVSSAQEQQLIDSWIERHRKM